MFLDYSFFKLFILFSSTPTTAPAIILWNCLIDTYDPHSSSRIDTNFKNLKHQKSFVEVVNNIYDIPLIQLPNPYVKGDRIPISVSKDEYQLGLEDCKHDLHGRVIWLKGTSPLTVAALKNKALFLLEINRECR
ncbi:unnamed protein product [Lathyrus sativus]|nr:unnamed protein product [Lathyrus sativus]